MFLINNMGFRKQIIFLLIITLTFACNKKVDYYNIPVKSLDNNFNAVIEIPAGTNKKFEYNKESQTFEIDKKERQERVINFLPYPGNYGFLPSTYSDPKKGGDGDALDVLVLSESVATGTVLEISPIALLKLIDNGEVDYKVIAIPSDVKHQIIKVNNYNDFSNRFPEIKQIIELWFLNYNKADIAVVEGWEDEKMAIIEINKNKL